MGDQMKYRLFIVAVLALSGCAELDNVKPDEWSQWPQEDQSDAYYHSPEEWKIKGFSYHDARQWHDLGYSPNDADTFMQNGATTAEEVSIIGRVFNNSSTPTAAYAGNYKYIFSAIAQNKFSLADLQSAANDNPGIRQDEIFKVAEKIHQGLPSHAVYTNMRQDQARDRYREGINTYGQDIINRCHGVPETAPIMLAFQDPYATENSCYTAVILSRWGQKQWVDKNTVLIVDAMPGSSQTFATFVTDPNGHVRYGATAVMIGGTPTTYTSVLGERIVAPTLSVLKYIP